MDDHYTIHCKECPDFSVAATHAEDVGDLAAKHRDEVHPGVELQDDPVYAMPVPPESAAA